MFDSSFEIKFSQLADARLQEMVPSLSKFKVGFQLIDKNDDDTKGLGVLAFLINNTWVYVPAFFLSGKLKMPMLYLKNYDTRVPLNDSWVSYVKSNELEEFGQLVAADSVRVDQGKADLLNIIGKRASANELIPEEELTAMFRLQDFPKTDLMSKLSSLGKEAFMDFADNMAEDTELTNAVLTYYSPEDLRKTAEALDNEVVDEVVEVPEVRVLDKNSAEAKELDDDAKEILMKLGYYLQDDRTETSLVFNRGEAEQNTWSSPNSAGLYEVLLEDGSTKDFMILFPNHFGDIPYPSRHGHRRISSVCAMIPVGDSKKYFTITASKVLTRNKRCYAEAGSKGAKVTPDKLTLRSLAEKNGDVLLVDSCGNAFALNKEQQMPALHFTGREGVMHEKRGTLMIPECVLSFEQMTDYKDARGNQLALGDVDTFIRECEFKAGLTPLKIYGDESGYSITSSKVDTKPMKKKAALLSLVMDHGVALPKALGMLKSAECLDKRPKINRYMLKMSGVSPSKQMGTIGHQVGSPVESSVTTSPQFASSMATKAADTGMKEVLDTSAMASLLGGGKPMRKLGEVLPDMIKSMNALGSVLCLYYWDNEDFDEHFGKRELVELEDKLLAMFEGMGDLVLFLREKTTDTDSLFDGDQGNISEDIGD